MRCDKNQRKRYWND